MSHLQLSEHFNNTEVARYTYEADNPYPISVLPETPNTPTHGKQATKRFGQL